MIRTRGLTHIALSVADPERSFRFYEQVFGMTAVYRSEGFIQAQTPGTWDVLVFERSPHGAGRPTDNHPRVQHFGFRLVDPADIDEAARTVEAAGGVIESRGEFCPDEPYLFVADPDGNVVEIWYEIPTPVDPA